jgi:parallel beta-helix repeat protein
MDTSFWKSRNFNGLFLLLFIFISLFFIPGSVAAETPVPAVDHSPTSPLGTPSAPAEPRYISGIGIDNVYTIFYEDRHDTAGCTSGTNRIYFDQTTTGPLGFAASGTATNICDSHFLVKDWTITISGTLYNYRAWGAGTYTGTHNFYVSNDLINWTLVNTFTFDHPSDGILYSFHDIVKLNNHYIGWVESAGGNTYIASSDNGDDIWTVEAEVGGGAALSAPLSLYFFAGITGPKPAGNFVLMELDGQKTYAKLYYAGDYSGAYLAINRAAAQATTPADAETAFKDPDNWTWRDGTIGLPKAADTVIASTIGSGGHDVREGWMAPMSDYHANHFSIYTANYASGAKGLGWMSPSPSIVWVDDGYNASGCTTDGHTWGMDCFATIQNGINAVASGGTINVAAGTYAERLTISKSLNLYGAQYGVDPTPTGARLTPASETIIDITGLTVANPNVAVEIPSGVTNVTLDGFTIIGSPTLNYADESVIRWWSNNITISYNILNGYYDLLDKGANTATISHNRIITNKVGITVQPNTASNVAISGNQIIPGTSPASDAQGIYMTGCTTCSVINNTITGFSGSNAIGGSNLPSLTISGNTLTGNKKGVNVWGNSDPVTISNNTISNNVDGIGIKGANITISGNTIQNNTNGGITIDKNSIETQNVTILHNVISGNTIFGLTVVQPAVIGPVDAKRNWWGAATGPTSGEIVGTVPYIPWCGEAACTTDVYPPVHNLTKDTYYPTIQAAVADANLSGDTIAVAAGTFTETGQIVINKSLSLVGADKTTTIIKPALDTSGTGDAGSWILVNDGVTFNLSKVNLDGIGRQIRQGIRFNGSGTVDDVIIQNMVAPGYMGFGIAQGYDNTGPRTLTVTNSTFTNFGRVGIQADNGTGTSTVTITGNTFVGKGTGDHLDYAITVEGGAVATISNNDISNCKGVASSDGSTSAGIAATTYFASGTTATITNNNFHDNSYGIAAGYDASDTTAITATGNTFTSNDFQVTASGSGVSLNFATTLAANNFDKAVTVTHSGSLLPTIWSKIQDGINAAVSGDTVNVEVGTYDEDLTINKSISLLGAGTGTKTIRGVIGGGTATIQVGASNVTIAGFTITRLGNTVAEWNLALNSTGIAIQGVSNTNMNVHDNIITHNRTGIDINNSSGNTITSNMITDNRTGMIFRNQTDNMTVTNNEITNNWTMGILFLDASSGTNSPVQTALYSTFSHNNLSGNWYGQVVERQTGGSLPLPGTTNLKNFVTNWWGATPPVVSTADSTEPGYSSQIPVEFGGTAVAPGDQPDILGPASANIVYIPWCVDASCINPSPLLPSTFHGYFHYYVTQPPVGTTLEAYVTGVAAPVKTTSVFDYIGDRVFQFDVPAATPGEPKNGGEPGDTVTFKIDGRILATKPWLTGTDTRLDFHPPEAVPGAYNGLVNATIHLNATANDWASDVSSYAWDLDNNGTYETTGQNITHAWTAVGDYTIGLQVIDSQNGVGTATTTVHIASITLGSLTGQVYDGTPKAATATTNPDGLTVHFAYTPTDPPVNAGDYGVTATIDGYTGSVTGTLTISKASLVITANSTSKVYGITLTFTGTEFTTVPSPLYNGDSVTSVSLASLGAVSSAPVADYDIEPSAAAGTGLGNYTIVYHNGTLHVTPASASIVSVGNLNPVKGVDPIGVTVTTSPTGVTTTATYSSDTYGPSTTPPTDPGTYTVEVVITDPNYTGDSVTETMHIQTTCTTSLISGWNLVSLCLAPVNIAPGTVLGSLGSKYDLVYGWDGSVASNNWKKFSPSGPPFANDLTRLDEKMGFWIHMTQATTLTVTGYPPSTTDISIYSVSSGGWNLVGFPKASGTLLTTPMPGIMSSHGLTAFDLVYAFHAYDTADQWKLFDNRPGVPGFASDLKFLEPGWGYWVQATGDMQTWQVAY